jgi:glycyl-tRNA synthetase
MITDNKISCPICKQTNWAPIHKFNLMFQIHQGILADDHSINYLRPETAQGIFVNFLNVQRSLRLKIPFGIAQIGKSFRNEITPGNFIFRTREFEQMELEYFVNPNEADKTFEFLLKKIKNFLSTKLKINDKNLFFREHQKDELSHYSKRTVDIEFAFPHGKKEL